MALEACAKRLTSAPRGGSECRGVSGDAFQRIIVAFLDPTSSGSRSSGKDAGHRDECRDGLLFPPEQLLKCTVSERIQAEFLLGVRLRVRTVPDGPHVAVIRNSSEYSKILMICDGSQKPPPLTCWNGMDLEEVGAQR
jgi:hypothetical protein